MLYIFRKSLGKNLVYIFTFLFQFLCVADYMKCINETTTPIEMSTGLVDSILRPKVPDNRMEFYLFFAIFQRSTFNIFQTMYISNICT